jgi:hypothetical protein
MSQHSDLLTYAISKGIAKGESAMDIVRDLQDILDVLEYDSDFTDLKNVARHAWSHASGMLMQRDWLYGISHKQLNKFKEDIWINNQWLTKQEQ